MAKKQIETEETEVDVTPKNEPNVRLASGQTPLGQGFLAGGATHIEIPSEAEQIAGFFSPFANSLIGMFPGKFKLIKDLGEKS